MYKINTDSVILESLKTHPYINQNIEINYYESPFNHVVINNFFNNETYKLLCQNFNTYISRTGPYKDQPGAVHDYAGYIYGFKPEDCVNGYDFFISDIWKNFCSNTFNIETNKYTALSAHWHKAPSKAGFVHKDLNICSVMPVENDNIKLTGSCHYAEDSVDKQPNSLKIIRSIALLFYLNNKEILTEEDKGGTGIYSSWGFDTFIKEIKPVNNSVFIFEVCPDSFHGFSGANFDRSSMVQWFHSSPAAHLYRHLSRVKYYHKHHSAAYERWDRTNNPWPIEHDPDYGKYFTKDFYSTLND